MCHRACLEKAVEVTLSNSLSSEIQGCAAFPASPGPGNAGVRCRMNTLRAPLSRAASLTLGIN